MTLSKSYWLIWSQKSLLIQMHQQQSWGPGAYRQHPISWTSDNSQNWNQQLPQEQTSSNTWQTNQQTATYSNAYEQVKNKSSTIFSFFPFFSPNFTPSYKAFFPYVISQLFPKFVWFWRPRPTPHVLFSMSQYEDDLRLCICFVFCVRCQISSLGVITVT